MCNQYIISFLFTVRLIEFGAFLKIIGHSAENSRAALSHIYTLH